MKFSFKKNIPIQILFLIFGICLQFSLIFIIETRNTYKSIDRDLLEAASDIKYILGEDFISKGMGEDTLSLEDAYKKFTVLHKRAVKTDLAYLYVLIKSENEIFYVAQSDTLDELKRLENAGYWYPLREARDNSYEKTMKAFDSNKPVYLESEDKWGSYRSIYIPEVSADGQKYLAGADISMPVLKKMVLYRSFQMFAPFLLSLFIIIPSIIAIRKNIMEKKNMENYIEFINKRDPLTSDYSRDYGLQLLARHISEYHSLKKPFSVCLIDIDNLKTINKIQGISAGNSLIKILSHILKSVFRKSDTFIRLEGNKLLVVLPEFDHTSSHHIYREIEKKLDFFNRQNKKEYFLRLNYTMNEYRGDSLMNFLESTRQNLRIESSKEKWKNRNLQDDILRGIKNSEFITYFQPKIHFKEKKVTFEALVRWQHPKRGIISPNEFIPIAENSFLINEITTIVLKDSLKLAETLKTNISVNLSLISFENMEFIQELKSFLEKTACSEFITFELTERAAVTHFEETLSKIEILKKCGVSFAIDDFGSGYSALSYLEKLPINELKIDKSFIDNINTSPVNQIIIEFINEIAKVQNFKVICEGTERREQIEKLLLLDNHSFQGYYFGHPEPYEEVVSKYHSGFYHIKIKSFI